MCVGRGDDGYGAGELVFDELVEVVFVVVGEEDCINVWQFFQINRGIGLPGCAHAGPKMDVVARV